MGRLFIAGWNAIQGGTWSGLVVIALLCAFNVAALKNTVLPTLQARQTGGLTATTEQILAMTTAANEYQTYTITGSDMFDSGFEYIVTSKSGPIETGSHTTYYGMLLIGDRLLLVRDRTPIDENKVTYTGTFSNYLPDKMRDGFANEYPELKKTLLPVYFDEGERGASGSTEFIMAAQAFTIVLIVYALWRFITVTVFKHEQA